MVNQIIRRPMPKQEKNPEKDEQVKENLLESALESTSQSQQNVIYEKTMRGRDYITAVTTKIIEANGIGNPFTGEVYRAGGREFWVNCPSFFSHGFWNNDNEFLYLHDSSRALFLKKQEKRFKMPFGRKCGENELLIEVTHESEPIIQQQIDSLIDDIPECYDINSIRVLASEKGVKTDIRCLHPNKMFVLVDLEKNIVTMDPRFKSPSYARTMFGVNYDWIFYPNNISHDKWERLYQNSKKIQYMSDFVNGVNI